MLTTEFLHTSFRNPLVLASGIVGLSAASLARAVANGAGAVTTKSISREARTGHANPTIVGGEHYCLNAVGLSNPGLAEAMEEFKTFRTMCAAPLFVSIFAGSADEFGALAHTVSETADFIEINLSCPNVHEEFGRPFAVDPKQVEIVTRTVKARAGVPLIVKLSPNALDIAEIAKAAEAAGADALCVINTMSGMGIDVRMRCPVLKNKQGGVSGPALFPVALKCVFDVRRAVQIPIIGTGGVTTGEDALAMIMAGATLVGVGSAVYYRGEDCFVKIAAEMEAIMAEERIASLAEVRGTAVRDQSTL